MNDSRHLPDTPRANLAHHLMMSRAQLFLATVELDDAITTGAGLSSAHVREVMAIQHSTAELIKRTLAYFADATAATVDPVPERSG